MRKVLAVVCAVWMAAGAAAAPSAGDVGIGVLAGSPFGPTVKLWLNPRQALNVGIGFNDLAGYVDYQWHSWSIFPQPARNDGRFGGYAALGAKVEDDDDERDPVVGIRTMLGAAYFLPFERIEIFFEAGPVFEMTPDTDVELDAGLGVRFYFGR